MAPPRPWLALAMLLLGLRLLLMAPDADADKGTSHDVARERKELSLYPYPHTYGYQVAQAHQAELREEAAQQWLARQVRRAPQGPVQPRREGTTLLDQCRGAIARLRAMVVA
jgi:hypothetical protein